MANNQDFISILKNVSFFQAFRKDTEMLSKISLLCKKKFVKKGKAIISEGESGDKLYIIASGDIDIIKKTLQKEEYTVTTLSSSTCSVYVGELALIDNDRRSATVLAKTDCHCLVIDRDDFIKFGNENPRAGLEITRIIARQLSQNLRKSNQDVITIFSALVEEISGNG